MHFCSGQLMQFYSGVDSGLRGGRT